MLTQEILKRLKEKGVSITVDGTDLVLSPATGVTHDLLISIRENKESLYAAHAAAQKFEAMGYRLEIDDPNGDLEILQHAA